MTSNYHAERREIRTGGQRELEGAAVVLDPSRIQPGTNSLPNRCGGGTDTTTAADKRFQPRASSAASFPLHAPEPF